MHTNNIFKQGDVIATKMFGDNLYFAEVIDPRKCTCKILSQNKIPEEIVGSVLFYSEELSEEAWSKYKELYPENII